MDNKLYQHQNMLIIEWMRFYNPATSVINTIIYTNKALLKLKSTLKKTIQYFGKFY